MNLTKPQEMIWQMEQFSGGSISVICTSLLLNGIQEEKLLQQAVDSLLCQNDSLRTRIRTIGSDVTQYIQPHIRKDVPVLRFANFNELAVYAEQYAKTAFDICASLCEIQILILPDQYGLLVKVHHLIADAWTMALLATQFHMLLEGKQPRCGSYQTYFDREKDYLNSRRYTQDRRFFLDLVSGADEPSFLSDQQTHDLSAERERFIIPKDFSEQIQKFAEVENISVFSIFSTVLASYISRINANAEPIFIGTTVLNRINEAEMHTAGMYVNTVPLLIKVRKDHTFRECLEETEDMLMSVFRHQQYNYTQLQTDLAKEQAFSGRLYDVSLHYLNAAVDHAHPDTTHIWHHNGAQNESLQLHIDDRDQEGIFCLTYDYQTAKFSSQQIQRLHEHFINMLRDGIENPQQPCHALCMLSPYEEHQLLFSFNNTATAYDIPTDATISSLFEKNAQTNFTKPCIFIGEERVTYGDFLRYSKQIDAEIRRKTNSQKTVIAVIADRSLEMYSAIYGILRGGNAYLPIPPETPKERIRYMLENSGASLVLAQNNYMDLSDDLPCIDLSAAFPEADVSIPCAAKSQDTAYVMYTSGSTGMPKGVAISHASVLNRILWMQDTYPLKEDSIILQKTVCGFDVSVWEILWWGICGGAMAVSLPGEHASPVKILHEISRHRITHLHFVPSVFDLFLNYLEYNENERSKFKTVKHVFLSGEKLDAFLVNRFYQIFDHANVQLSNLYGPTECTVDVTYYNCLPNESVVPIGKPIHNTQIYITDQNLNLLPIGIKGELVIGGHNVGKGYINDPDLTKKRFVDNPFAKGKLYKSGDIAYWNEEGQIIYCDRIDTQVKINGQRIELTEIELVIKRVPEVKSVAVIVRKQKRKNLLIAYYSGSDSIEAQIYEECEKKLPRHMIPTLMRVDRLPLHPNGKLDKKKLLEMPITLLNDITIDPPINDTEKHICDIFSRVLHCDKVGRNSDFFALGGDSLSVISFLLESGYDQQISTSQFIGNSTPAQLAALVMRKVTGAMKYVQAIHNPENATSAYVFFPFAGGDAQMFLQLARSFMQHDDSVALYYVPYLHDLTDCEAAAEEIVSLAQNCALRFYSHCAGAAVALCILQIIEQRYGSVIQHYYAAGNVPFKSLAGFNGWNYVPAKMLLRILKKAGAPDSLVNNGMDSDMTNRFRQDTNFASMFFAKKPVKISCPTTLLLAQKDIFTRYFPNIKKHWHRYVQHIDMIHYIETVNHYFHSENSDTIAKWLLSHK